MMLQSQRDVKTFLTNNLEAGLVHIENLYSLTADRWKFLDIYLAPAQQYPSISILANSTGEQQIGAGNRANNGLVRRFNNIQVSVWHRGNRSSTRKIEDNVVMYMDAFEYIFENDANMSLRTYQFVRITGTDYTELFPESIKNAQSLLLKGAVLSIELRPNY